MNLTAFENSLKTTAPPPIALIIGPERFFRGEAIRLITEAISNADIIELDPRETDARALTDDLRTPSLFAPRRILLLDNAETIIIQSGELLAGYAAKPAANAHLVLVAEHLDARKKAAKALLACKSVIRIDCAPLKERDVPQWCTARARLPGKRMDIPTARLLVELAGANLGRLDGQINSLAAYCEKRKAITRSDIENLVGGDHTRKIWELTDSVMNHNPAKALKAFDRLTREPGSAEFAIIPALAAKLRDMLAVKRMTDAGKTPDAIRAALGKHPYVIKLLQQVVRNTSQHDLAAKYTLLLEADVDLKTLPNHERKWIAERLIIQLCESQRAS